MKKEQILEEIRRTAAENGGVALGQRRFETLTGISRSVWYGKFWRGWTDAVIDAGLSANATTAAHDHSAMISSMARLTRRLGRFPGYVDLRFEKERDKGFPGRQALAKLGGQPARIELVRVYATDHDEYRDVLALLPPPEEAVASGNAGPDLGDGAVYLVKLGKHYKIGSTFSVPRRHREISLELPEKPQQIHAIKTDDPAGIEAYWHNRFAAKHTNGEWFVLDPDDVRAFKRRKFM
jgi:hypothetical protein